VTSGAVVILSSVQSITLTDGGSGYTSTPSVVFSGGGGSGAAANAIVSGGVVTAINLTQAGSNYTSAPSISITGGGGSGATATLVVAGPTATITPPSSMTGGKETFIVVPANAFTNPDGDAGSANALINDYSFTVLAEGGAFEGGYLLCCSSNIFWIVAPYSAEVTPTTWHQRASANTCAQNVSGCGGWFVPTRAQLQNPGYTCVVHWDQQSSNYYWSNTGHYYHPYFGVPPSSAYAVAMNSGAANNFHYHCSWIPTRSFRCVSY
jgi:hypothetical protein